jgi:uncharacterized membrane protein HdeD (DUF308 family)
MSNASPQEPEGLDWVSAWWLVLLVGCLSVIAGVIILAKPSDSLATLAVIAGVFVLVDGIVELVASLSRKRADRGFLAVWGVLTVIVGVLLIRHPIPGVAAVAFFIGIWLLAVGVFRLLTGFFEPEHRAWNIILAVIELVAGTVIVASPDIGFATLALLVGITFIANGVVMMILGRQMREIKRETAIPAGPGSAAGPAGM